MKKLRQQLAHSTTMAACLLRPSPPLRLSSPSRVLFPAHSHLSFSFPFKPERALSLVLLLRTSVTLLAVVFSSDANQLFPLFHNFTRFPSSPSFIYIRMQRCSVPVRSAKEIHFVFIKFHKASTADNGRIFHFLVSRRERERERERERGKERGGGGEQRRDRAAANHFLLALSLALTHSLTHSLDRERGKCRGKW